MSAPANDLVAPVTLKGRHATLVPLAPEHAAALTDAARDGELWKLWYISVPAPERVADEIERRLGLHAKGSMLPFTVLDEQGVPAGMTTFMNIDAVNRRGRPIRCQVTCTPLLAPGKDVRGVILFMEETAAESG